MSSESVSNYLHDLGELIKEKAREAKIKEEASDGNTDNGFELGRLMAYHEVVSLMQQQAEIFDIPLEEIGLADINPERDLL